MNSKNVDGLERRQSDRLQTIPCSEDFTRISQHYPEP